MIESLSEHIKKVGKGVSVKQVSVNNENERYGNSTLKVFAM